MQADVLFQLALKQNDTLLVSDARLDLKRAPKILQLWKTL